MSEPSKGQQKDGAHTNQGWGPQEDYAAVGWGHPGDSAGSSWMLQDHQETSPGWASSDSVQVPPPKSLPTSSSSSRPPPSSSLPPPLPRKETFRPRPLSPRASPHQSISSDDSKVASKARNVSKLPSIQEEINFRIKIFAKAVRLRLKLIDYQEDKTNWNRLPKSARYEHLGEAGQNILQQRRDERDAAMRSSKEEFEKIITELREMEAWPVAVHSGRADETTRAVFADVQHRLQLLEGKFQMFQNEYLKPKTDYRDVYVSTMEDSDHQVSEPEERDFFNRLEALEERIDDIANATILQVLEARESLEWKMDDFRLNLQIDENAAMNGDSTANTPVTLGEKLQWYSNELDSIATELGERIVGDAQLQSQMSQLEKDNTELKIQLEEAQKYNQLLKMSIENNAKELQALSEAIKVLQLQASYRSNSLDERIIGSMQRRITQDIIDTLKPSLDDLIAQLDARMKTSQDETLERIASDFGPAINLINTLYNNLITKVHQAKTKQ